MVHSPRSKRWRQRCSAESWRASSRRSRPFSSQVRTTRSVHQCHPNRRQSHKLTLSASEGFCYPRDVLFEYARFAEKWNLFLVMDEVYANSVYDSNADGRPFVSILSVDVLREAGCDPSRVLVLYGMSKDFGANGFRGGTLVCQHNEEFMAALASTAMPMRMGSPTDILWSALLESPELPDYLAMNRRALSKAYKYVTAWLEAHNLPYTPANAGHFVLVDLRTHVGQVQLDGGTHGAVDGDTDEGDPFPERRKEEDEAGEFKQEIAFLNKLVDEGVYLGPGAPCYTRLCMPIDNFRARRLFVRLPGARLLPPHLFDSTAGARRRPRADRAGVWVAGEGGRTEQGVPSVEEKGHEYSFRLTASRVAAARGIRPSLQIFLVLIHPQGVEGKLDARDGPCDAQHSGLPSSPVVPSRRLTGSCCQKRVIVSSRFASAEAATASSPRRRCPTLLHRTHSVMASIDPRAASPAGSPSMPNPSPTDMARLTQATIQRALAQELSPEDRMIARSAEDKLMAHARRGFWLGTMAGALLAFRSRWRAGQSGLRAGRLPRLFFPTSESGAGSFRQQMEAAKKAAEEQGQEAAGEAAAQSARRGKAIMLGKAIGFGIAGSVFGCVSSSLLAYTNTDCQATAPKSASGQASEGRAAFSSSLAAARRSSRARSERSSVRRTRSRRSRAERSTLPRA